MQSLQTLLPYLLLITISSPCHYSCSSCANPLYTSCVECASNYSLTVLQDPSSIPTSLWFSVYPVGTCLFSFQPSTNPLGFILLISCILFICLTRQPSLLWAISSLQTLALFSLLEAPWFDSIDFILAALRCLMPLSLLTSLLKTPSILPPGNRFRLFSFLIQSQIGINLSFIAPIFLLILITLSLLTVGIKIVEPHKIDQKQLTSDGTQNSQRQSNIPQSKECCKIKKHCLIPAMEIIIAFGLLLIQDIILIIITALVFNFGITSAIVTIIASLCIGLFMAFALRYPILGSHSHLLLFCTQKIIVTALILIPFKHWFVIFIAVFIFTLLSVVLDLLNKMYSESQRLLILRVIQVQSLIFTLSFISADQIYNTDYTSLALGLMTSISISLNISFFCFEGIYYIGNQLDAKLMSLFSKTDSTEIECNKTIQILETGQKDEQGEQQISSQREQFSKQGIIQTNQNQVKVDQNEQKDVNLNIEQMEGSEMLYKQYKQEISFYNGNRMDIEGKLQTEAMQQQEIQENDVGWFGKRALKRKRKTQLDIDLRKRYGTGLPKTIQYKQPQNEVNKQINVE